MRRNGSKAQENLFDASWDRETSNQPREYARHEAIRSTRVSPFVNLPYRFVLRQTVDKRESKLYQEAFKDVDMVLDWKFVEFVLVPLEYLSTCPICLDTPVIPRMASCGHLFCYECILAYLLCAHSSDEEAIGDNEKKRLIGKCPVCSVVVTERELKPIYIESLSQKNPSVGQFTLMARKISMPSLVLPANYPSSLASIEAFQPFEGVYDGFLRYSVLKTEANEWWLEYLQQELSYFERESTKTQVQETAIRQLRAKIARVRPETLSAIESDVSVNSCLSSEDFEIARFANSTAEFSSPTHAIRSSSRLENSSFVNAPNPKAFFYFYQKIDFSNGYNLSLLDPLCIKILQSQFNSYHNFPLYLPSDISLIDQKHCVIESDLFYKKFKYLSHLSVGTIVTFCTVDLSSVVSPSVWQTFQPEIQAITRAKHQKNWAEDLRATSILDDHQQMVRLISRSFERTSISSTSPDTLSLPPGTRFDDDAHFPAPSQAPTPAQASASQNNAREKNVWETALFVNKKTQVEEFPALE